VFLDFRFEQHPCPPSLKTKHVNITDRNAGRAQRYSSIDVIDFPAKYCRTGDGAARSLNRNKTPTNNRLILLRDEKKKRKIRQQQPIDVLKKKHGIFGVRAEGAQ